MKQEFSKDYQDSFNVLKNTIAFLRSKDGCPWDQKQTHNSLKKNLLEESYELLDALESKDPQKIKEELGDLVCQVFFHCEIAEETGEFSISDVFSILNEKLIRRHPHVFGDSKALNPEDAHAIWQESKLKENPNKSFLDGIPNSMPELAKAQLFQERAGLQGFDWDNIGDVIKKISEEFEEYSNSKTEEEKKEELGDLLFSIVNLARWVDIYAEDSLRKTNQKFYERFKIMEELAKKRNESFKEMSMDKKEMLWEEAKVRLYSKNQKSINPDHESGRK